MIVNVLNLDIKKLFPVALALIAGTVIFILFLIQAGYQYALLHGLGEYIQDDVKYPRTNLYHANKEGIVSLIGKVVTIAT